MNEPDDSLFNVNSTCADSGWFTVRHHTQCLWSSCSLWYKNSWGINPESLWVCLSFLLIDLRLALSFNLLLDLLVCCVYIMLLHVKRKIF